MNILLLLFEDSFMSFLSTFAGVIVTVITIIAFASSKKQKQAEETIQKYTTNKSVSSKPTYQTAKSNVAKSAVPKSLPKHQVAQSTLNFDNVHDYEDHIGSVDGVEEVEEIVGSLGHVNDEGCKELAKVRFLTNTTTTEDGTQQSSIDNQQLVLAMILGSAIAEPKFKQM